MARVNCDFSWQGTRLAVDIKPTFNFVFLSHLLPVPMTTDLLAFRFTRDPLKWSGIHIFFEEYRRSTVFLNGNENIFPAFTLATRDFCS